jgi:hypothetical protein
MNLPQRICYMAELFSVDFNFKLGAIDVENLRVPMPVCNFNIHSNACIKMIKITSNDCF